MGSTSSLTSTILSSSQFTTSLLPPPGPILTRPNPADPAPANNPPIFNDAMSVRTAVFIDEQRCSPENEIDDDDARSWHWVLYSAESDRRIPVGVIRLIPPPHAPHELRHEGVLNRDCSKKPLHGNDHNHNNKLENPYIKLSRVALLAEFRGAGLARVLVNTALGWAAQHHSELRDCQGKPWAGDVLVHAQVAVEKIYAHLGFVTDASMGTWVEEGMDHVGMWRKIKVPSE
ncbi:uncharacterized protein PADG_06563 [Paracoccidioides brasiliensis Pb18]|uniref:N-acetyltransferase domain-containing protein n=1 Tax=Paracoccidioides brasiliensis (strain Pb18) TaxID=502780 RepID=C1GH27_PARBD|nr:uncharacterized protein PADG_06563 [Paracoccidioides brasiliensis Pb18]EEH50484.2 hypothetical protein PADG_06563 [Paracoccidioides brasiliensis Pb18]ODH45579.1 hypothetical protein GX48_08349 [Paracoccidioides brasiliensis]